MTANIRREFADMATVVTAPDVGGGLSTSLGLTTAQATVALKQVGLDQVETTKRFRLVREGLALVANPLVLILIAVNTIRPLAVGVAAHRRGATCFRSAQSRRRYGFRLVRGLLFFIHSLRATSGCPDAFSFLWIR